MTKQQSAVSITLTVARRPVGKGGNASSAEAVRAEKPAPNPLMHEKEAAFSSSSEPVIELRSLDGHYAHGGIDYAIKVSLAGLRTSTRQRRWPKIVVIGVLAFGLLSSALLSDAAHAQSAQPNPVEQARKAIQTLIDRLRGSDMPEGIVKTNGRIEATEVDVAAKYPGRLVTLTVNEGDEVTAGQVVGRISSPDTEAQLRGSQAQVLKAKQALAQAEATIVQRTSERSFEQQEFQRFSLLVSQKAAPQERLDQISNQLKQAQANYDAAIAQRDEADASIKAAVADVERLQSILTDLTLVSPRTGRVEYRLVRTGEVVAPGQRILTLLDLKDVYMTIYLPANVAGALKIGDEARTILDPLPQFVLPNTISFVATEAQFTPKSVETAEEREKLMFRVKLQADPGVLDKYYRYVKTGVRGLAFVRTDPKNPWPSELAVKLPQ